MRIRARQSSRIIFNPMHNAVSLSSIWLFAVAAAIAIAAVAVTLIRRPEIPPTALWIALAGLLCLAAAAGGPLWHWPTQRSAAVLVDLSPSTRGASFRDPTALARRLDELLGSASYHVWAFADGRAVDFETALPELPADRTRLPRIDADAIVLFSDCRFDLPLQSPPVYVVADANLENVADASVDRLEIHGRTLTAAISNTDRQRVAIFDGISGPTTAAVDTGGAVIPRPLTSGPASASVVLSQGDLWPENDAMSIPISPPFASEAWWVSHREAPPSSSPDSPPWKTMLPAELPQDPARYLAPSVIVLDNVSSSDILDSAADHLLQYVRDLGGSLVILGGDQSFAAGGYPGTPLQTLSPLSSYPPQPSTRWIVLADSSGSMSADDGGTTRWQAASDAAARILPLLPPKDSVQIGQFSGELKWWSTGKTAADTADLPLPPADAVPFGPTDLEAALDHIAAEADPALPTRLLVLTDCDANISQPDQLVQIMRHKQMQLYVLALAHGSGWDQIQKLAQSTGGSIVEQRDSKLWYESFRKLTRAAQPAQLMTDTAAIQFVNRARRLPTTTASGWNRTWLNQDARQWAQSTNEDPPAPMAAFWRVGRGSVIAAAFSPNLDQAAQLAEMVALNPTDPRFTIAWQTGRSLSVKIDAIDGNLILNNLKFSLQIKNDSSEQTAEIPQTAPGEYSLSLPAPRDPGIATLRSGDRILDRIAVPGRYPEEFDALGNDHDAMQTLADRTRGDVIWPTDHHKIDFHWPPDDVPLTPWLAAGAAALLAAALLRYRAE
jgi:hypothetical protein